MFKDGSINHLRHNLRLPYRFVGTVFALMLTSCSRLQGGGMNPAPPTPPAPGLITVYRLPTINAYPVSVEAGTAGDLWFTEFNSGKIEKITSSGSISEYPIPKGNAQPGGIAGGPDGDLWFAEENGDKIAKIVP